MAVGAVDGAGADADVGSNVQAFQTEFLRNLVADAMEELRDEIHHDIQSLHVDMLRQFHTFHVRFFFSSFLPASLCVKKSSTVNLCHDLLSLHALATGVRIIL